MGFANTLYVEEVRIAVKANSGIKSISDLNGKQVAITTGTTSVQLLRKHERANGVNFVKYSVKIMQIASYCLNRDVPMHSSWMAPSWLETSPTLKIQKTTKLLVKC